MRLFKWMASNVFGILGGLSLGMSFPTTHFNILGDFCPDFVVFLPLGVVLIGISFYYTFVDKSWKMN